MMLSPETVADVAAIILLYACVPAALIVYGVRAWRRGLRVPEGLGPGLAVILSLAISHSVAVDSSDSADRIIQWLCYVALFALALAVPRRWTLRGLYVVGVVVIGSVVGGMIQSGARSGGMLRNPNIAASVLAVTSPVFQSFFEGGLMVAALFATGSRGALLGVTLAITWDTFRKKLIPVALVGVCALAMIAARPSTAEKRLGTWTEAGRLFLARPVTGWGAGSYPHLAQNEQFHPHADSFPLTVAAEQGLLGLLAWGWLLYEVARRAWRSEDRARWGMVAFCVQNLVDCTLWWYWPGIAVTACAGLVIGGEDA
jgi:hypothetical protein